MCRIQKHIVLYKHNITLLYIHSYVFFWIPTPYADFICMLLCRVIMASVPYLLVKQCLLQSGDTHQISILLASFHPTHAAGWVLYTKAVRKLASVYPAQEAYTGDDALSVPAYPTILHAPHLFVDSVTGMISGPSLEIRVAKELAIATCKIQKLFTISELIRVSS